MISRFEEITKVSHICSCLYVFVILMHRESTIFRVLLTLFICETVKNGGNRTRNREKFETFERQFFGPSLKITESSSRFAKAVVSYFGSFAGLQDKPTMSFEAEKQKYLCMPAEEKRKLLKAEPVTVEQVSTWPEYWSKNKDNIVPLSAGAQKVNKALADKVSLWEGDITKLEIDAIVNAANSSLLGGGGVDGAIHRAAGGYLKQECATLNGCHVGEAKITGGYMLPSKYVIHTVGPQGEKPEKLQECYQNSLTVAKQNAARTIAFPCISTGIYGYPQKPAANVALSTVKKFLLDNPDSIDRVIFCVFLQTDKAIYEELLQKYFAFE